jgi:hypothetical protein
LNGGAYKSVKQKGKKGSKLGLSTKTKKTKKLCKALVDINKRNFIYLFISPP